MSRKASDNKAAKFVTAIGEPTRMAIIRLLAGGEKSVGEIAKALKTEIVNVSHHLGVLRDANLVDDRKDGRFVRYTLKDFVTRDESHGREVVVVHDSGTKVAIAL